MVVRGLKVQAQIPSVNSPRDSRVQDSGTRSHDGLTGAWVEVLGGSEHPAQPPGVVVHPNRPDLRQPNRPRMILPDADPVAAAWILLVAETEAVVIASFALGFREANLAATPLRVSSKPSTKIYRRLLKHLGRDLFPPGKPGHLFGRCPVWINHEHAAGALAGLPAVEGADQVKA